MAGTVRAAGSLRVAVNARPEPSLHLWLPALAAFAPGHPLRERLQRADRQVDGAAGYLAGLEEFFRGAGRPLPAAALTREWIAGDAAAARWLSADPAWVQPDMSGVRLLACGQLQLTMAEAQALAEPLRAVFDEAGMQLELSTPDRWHLRLPPELPLPLFAAPEQALGEDLAQHLPPGADGRRWRMLLNEIQVLLHQHPLNAARRARGAAPVNSLWLWGGGTLPGRLHSVLRGVISDDLLLRSLAARAGIGQHARTPASVAAASRGWLIDLQDLPAGEIAAHWWPLLQPLFGRQPVVLHFASAERWQHRPWHRWRRWRRAAP